MAAGRRGNYVGRTKNYGQVGGHKRASTAVKTGLNGARGHVARGAHRGGGGGGGALRRRGQVIGDACGHCSAA